MPISSLYSDTYTDISQWGTGLGEEDYPTIGWEEGQWDDPATEEVETTPGMDYWLDFCFAARLKEENLKISKAQYNMYLRNGRSMIKRVDISAGMNYINNMLKMLKSKQTNTRFCQNYDKCVD